MPKAHSSPHISSGPPGNGWDTNLLLPFTGFIVLIGCSHFGSPLVFKLKDASDEFLKEFANITTIVRKKNRFQQLSSLLFPSICVAFARLLV